MSNKITLISPLQGNPIALKRTLDSVKDIVDEIILGDVIVFDEDRKLVESYKKEYNIRLIKLPFSYIFHMGFANTLNVLAAHSTNDIVMYLNVGEVLSVGENILHKITPNYNSYFIDHPIEKHRWFRVYNRNEMKWDGIIHEEIVGDSRPYHKPLFTFEDTEKDLVDSFKAKVMNEIKESVYFNLYKQIVDFPKRKGITNDWWLNFAKENYDSMVERLNKKGDIYTAFKTGDFDLFLNCVFNSPSFESERHISSVLVDFQGDRKQL